MSLSFYDELKNLIHEYIMLNYVEGYGRTKKAVIVNFYETAFGSLKESIYTFYLALSLQYIQEEEYKKLFLKKERIAKMLWKTLEGIKSDMQTKQ